MLLGQWIPTNRAGKPNKRAIAECVADRHASAIFIRVLFAMAALVLLPFFTTPSRVFANPVTLAQLFTNDWIAPASAFVLFTALPALVQMPIAHSGIGIECLCWQRQPTADTDF